MNKTHKKLALIAISAFVVEAALVVGVATNFNAMALNPIKASSTDYSVTFSRSASTVESGSYASGSAIVSSRLSGGTKVFAQISGQERNTGSHFVRFYNSASEYVKFYFTGSEVTRFSSINSLDFTYSAYGIDAQGNFDIYYSSVEIDFNDSSTYSVISVSDAPASVNLGTSNVHYVALHSRDGVYAYIDSVKINYTCGEPVPESYGISYYGMDLDSNIIPLEGIDTSSLINEAQEGSTVVIEPEASSGYTFLGGFGYSEAVEDVTDVDGVITFTMPSEDVEFVLISRPTVPQLYSISISGYQTEFTQGDSFVFGGTVTARYTDGSTSNVTASATFTGYDMDEVGSQTVTVSYTYLGVLKTATYGITVAPDDPGTVVLTGTYQYASRSSHATPDWTLHNMTITFYNDGTAMWRNVRTDILSNSFDCKVYFTYEATDNVSNITVAMALTSYDFKKNGAANNEAKSFSGGSYDRPVDGGFTSATAKNNSIVMASNRASFTVNVYDQSHSYEVYDTFTFNLVS